MIRRHDFNSLWWGGEAGIVDDPARLFAASDRDRAKALEAYDWVELRLPLAQADPERIGRSGFFHADTQLPFRIGCAHVAATPSIASLDVTRASETQFRIERQDLAPFQHERYRHLPRVDDELLTERYALWASEQIDRSPEWCLRVESEGSVQGWFLAQTTREGLNLELAMLHRHATISGMYLYQRCIVEYARLGARVGHARFSVENTAVHNIYARLGAQFLAPVGVWFWIRP